MHKMSERGIVMMMRRRLTPVNMREQGPGPVGSAGKNGWLVVQCTYEQIDLPRNDLKVCLNCITVDLLLGR